MPSGIGAALAAARNGAQTILLEKSNCCGGCWTDGLDSGSMGVDFRIQTGIFKEICMELKRRGAVFTETVQHYQCDIEHSKLLFDELMLKAGVKVLYHAYGVDVIKDGNTITGVILDCEEGVMAIKAKMVIDCSGYGTLLSRSGSGI